MSQFIHFCFTLNNYTNDEYTTVIAFCERESKYWIVGKEVGDRGTPHLQGYASLRRRRTLNALKSEFSARAHIEVARGTARQNRAYCSKGGDFREGGNVPSNSVDTKKSRDELASEFAIRFREGIEGIQQFAGEYAGTWYYSGHNLLRNALTIQKAIHRPDIQVQWIYGAPGVGKSRKAHEDYPDAFIKDPRTKWWNGYMLEKSVIIDDFGPNGIDINHLLRWFDRYKCYVETKGGMVPLWADKFVVTSNFEPSDCFKDKEGVTHPQMDALYRRIEVIEM